MGGWFWLIALGLLLVLVGLYMHWTVVLLGALLPFLPVVAELLRRRRNMHATNLTMPPTRPSLSWPPQRLPCRQSGFMDMTGQVVLANRLADGRVVFLAADGSWVEDLAGGAMASDADAGERLLAAARLAESRNAVVEPYLIAVRQVAGQRQPVAWREAIRAAGPTVRTDLPG